MFSELSRINHRPDPFEYYTTPLMWNDPYVSKQMLKFHLHETTDLASRNERFIRKSSEWILDHFAADSSSKICDFGCGPGLYTILFARHGAQVTGIDLSETSICFAREASEKAGLSIRYIEKNYLEYAPGEKFNLITMIFCDFCVLSPQQRRALLNIFYHSLEDGGSLLFDVNTFEYFSAASEKRAYEYVACNGFWSQDPYYAFTNTFKYDEEKLILDKHSIVEKNRTREIFNWLQCYSIQSIEKELNGCGLYVSEVFSDVAGRPYHAESQEMAVVAKKIKQPRCGMR